MALIRGKGTGLELDFSDVGLDAGLQALAERLAEQPGFYRGTQATVRVSEDLDAEELSRLTAALESGGIELRAVAAGAAPADLAKRRAERPRRELKLSDSARSLIADFAGAREDIAQRRKRGEMSVRRVHHDASRPATPPLAVAPPPPGTLYHVGTLRGGQALHHAGNIIVVGDVNPGTEIVATGDIVVFGRLMGVAHAGAQGDQQAKVYALGLQATQLRIATCIALDDDARPEGSEAEFACVRDGRIVIAPFSKASEV